MARQRWSPRNGRDQPHALVSGVHLLSAIVLRRQARGKREAAAPHSFLEWGFVSMAKDVVCDMNVNSEQTPWKSEYQGKTYYFGSQQGKEQFNRNPQAYVSRHAG